MSAWVVPKVHIDVLVQALINEHLIDPADATAIGATLWKENHKSVNRRYGERRRTPKYSFTGIEAPLEDAAILGGAHCFTYQCAEFDGYDNQPGMRLITALVERMRARLGFATRDEEDEWRHRREEELGIHAWLIPDVKHAIRREAMGLQPPPISAPV